MLASGKGALADELVEPLASLCDDVGAMTPRQREAQGPEGPEGRPWALLKATWPVRASASIAQVHRVGNVAVKMQKTA